MQAGSDSLLTSSTFVILAKKYFQGVENATKHSGVLYGLGIDVSSDTIRMQLEV